MDFKSKSNFTVKTTVTRRLPKKNDFPLECCCAVRRWANVVLVPHSEASFGLQVSFFIFIWSPVAPHSPYGNVFAILHLRNKDDIFEIIDSILFCSFTEKLELKIELPQKLIFFLFCFFLQNRPTPVFAWPTFPPDEHITLSKNRKSYYNITLIMNKGFKGFSKLYWWFYWSQT